MPQKTALLWFRQDLRIKDNPALIYASEKGYRLCPIFILDDVNSGQWKHGGAQRWWLHKSLTALNHSLDGNLCCYQGDAKTLIPQIIKQTNADAVFWNRCYEPWRIKRDTSIKADLENNNIEVESFNASLLWEPWDIKNQSGAPYRVFTPFYRKGCLQSSEPAEPEPAPKQIYFSDDKQSLTIEELNLMPKIQWYETMNKQWEPGEQGAQARLYEFLETGLKGYKQERNRPDMENVSRLSPYLHFGEISPRDVWHTARAKGLSEKWDIDTDHFCSELGWREFSYHLLYHFPDMTWKNMQEKFDRFPWKQDDPENLERWQKGQTGIPIIDAGMRQLWQTGWMHNRVRMIVGSLLVKNLLIHWHHGEEWFWDTLLDADLANNAASWQWIAGCGADAAPYFRIFNPITQGEKFDPDGTYVRQFVPELKNMPKEFIHKPWDADNLTLEEAGIELGQNYPEPILDLKSSREQALEAYSVIKGQAA